MLLLAGGAFLAPVVVPVLRPDLFIAYTKRLPFKLPVMDYAHARAVLPRWYADQFGRSEIVAETAVAYNRLDPAERSDCGIFAQDYGQAGAIDFLGRSYGLPAALNSHQSWFLWGPRGCSGNCMISLDDRREVLEKLFQQVEYVGAPPRQSLRPGETDSRLYLQGREVRLPGPTLADFEALAVRQERRTHSLLIRAIAVRWPAERLPP
jgi:hypothetical protein